MSVCTCTVQDVHMLHKSYHVSPLCIVLWNTGCCSKHHFEELTTLRSRPFARYGQQYQFSWRQQLKPYAYSYRTQKGQLKPDWGIEERKIGSRETSGYTFLYYSFILYIYLTMCIINVAYCIFTLFVYPFIVITYYSLSNSWIAVGVEACGMCLRIAYA